MMRRGQGTGVEGEVLNTEGNKRAGGRTFARSAELATAGVAAEVEKEPPLPTIKEPRREIVSQQHHQHHQHKHQHKHQQQQEPSDEIAAGLVTNDVVSDQTQSACPPGSSGRGLHKPCNGGGGSSSSSSSSRGGQPHPKASAVDLAGEVATEEGLPAVFDIFDEGNGLSGNTAAAAAAAAAALASPELAGGMRPDLLGGMTGSRREAGTDYGVIGGALHIALALAVLVLVAFVKADDGAVRATPYGRGAGCSGGTGGAGTGSTPSRRRGSRTSSSSGNGDRVGGGGSAQRGSGAGSAKRRRVDGRSGSGHGAEVSESPIVRHLRAVWSKLWHLMEDDLATRWHAAGQMLATLRQAWSALWMPPPHPEADVLAEALASPPRFSQGADSRGAASRGGGGGGGGVGSSVRRKRRSGRARSTGSSGSLGAAESSPSVPLLGRPVGLNCLNFLSLCGYRPGGGRGSRQPKFLLLLDLDETLVHCSPHLMAPARRRSVGGGGGALRPDLKLEMRGRAPSDNRPSCMYAWKRPHLDVFLGVVSRWYEVAVFTSGLRSFAEPLIDLIDSRCVINKRFYRDSCVRRDAEPSAIGAGAGAAGIAAAGAAAATSTPAGSETVKDLRVVGSEHFPLRTVLVDNQPKTVVQQANVLPVRSWFPRDSEDRQLLDLLPVLLALTSCQDVRSVLSLRPAVGGGC
eukprot:g14611.t1